MTALMLARGESLPMKSVPHGFQGAKRPFDYVQQDEDDSCVCAYEAGMSNYA